MTKTTVRVALLLASGALFGCTGVTDFANPSSSDSTEHTNVSVQDIVTHIRCELRDTADLPVEGYDGLTAKDFDAYVVLNLKVDDSGSLAPSLTFIQPYTAMTSRSLGINLQWGESRERTFTQGYLFNISQIAAIPRCTSEQAKDDNFAIWAPNLRGNLELADVARIGLSSIPLNAVGITPAAFGSGNGYATVSNAPPPGPQAPGGNPAGSTAQPGTQGTTNACNPAATTLSFGSSLQFALTKGLGGGPSWTLTHFKAGSGGSVGGGSGGGSGSSGGGAGGGGSPGGPLSISRIDTDQLWITFAPDPVRLHNKKLERFKAKVDEFNKTILSSGELTKGGQTKFESFKLARDAAQSEYDAEKVNLPAEAAATACAFAGATPTMMFQSLSSIGP